MDSKTNGILRFLYSSKEFAVCQILYLFLVLNGLVMGINNREKKQHEKKDVRRI